MNETKQSLIYQTKANDVDEKGIVTVAVNGIGIEDSQHDISVSGSFDQTLKEDIGRMRHFLNHDTTQLLGCPLEGAEKSGNLVMVSQLNLKKQIGRDTLEDYKLFAECGRTLEHSIGVRAMKRDGEDRRKVLQWKMFEFSTLTSWGSNPQTFLVNLKSATAQQVRDAVDLIRGAFKQHGYSDERLKQYDMELNLLLKSLDGGTIVSCPHCGYQFDYDQQPEMTFAQQVIEAAAMYQRWITDDIVEQEINRLTPEIRQEVLALLDQFKGDRSLITEKSITDIAAFVRCPHCYSRVYRANNIIKTEESTVPEPTAKEDGKNDGELKNVKPSFWAKLSDNL